MSWTNGQQEAFFDHVNKNQSEYIQHLRKWVEIPSVSCQSNTRPEVIQMMHQAKAEFIETLGAKMWLVDNPKGTQYFTDGEQVPYPPVLLGTYPETFDPAKKTILLYGHLDVQPAQMSDGWDTEPFQLIEKDGKMFGRGSTDDKGPVLGWLLALKAFKDLDIELNVNLKFCFEGMEESGSVGLTELIFETCPEFFNTGVDGTCISDNYWLGTTKPCLTYGLRGISYWHLTVEGASRDLHSGVFGGTCHEAMTDLVYLFASLVNQKGEILVPGIYDDVAPVTAEEDASYDAIDFCKEEFKNSNGVNLIKEDKKATLMSRWRHPSCSLHGIEGAFYESGEKTVIPRRVIGKFSFRLVPDMKPAKVCKLVQAHIDEQVKKLGTPNKVWLTNVSGAEAGLGEAWYGNPSGFLFEAGITATQKVYKQDPDMTREGGSIPVTLEFQNATKKPVILLPMGAADDGAHSQNEKLNVRNYIEGVKLLGTFLQEIK